jgi:hypothetical protein
VHVFVAAPCVGCARARPKRRIRAMGRVNDLASQGSQSSRRCPMRTAFRTSKAERSAEHACKCSSALSRGKQDWMTGAIGAVVRLKPLASGRLNWSTCQRPQRRAPEFGLWLRCFRHGAHRATLLCLARGERSLRSALCVHGSPRCAALHLCGLGGCHTNDHLARRRSRCQSRGDVDNITKRREIADGYAKPGRPTKASPV